MRQFILTCSPHFTDLALNELQRHQPDAIPVQPLSPGHLLLQTPRSFNRLALPWRQKLPIYLHHLFPVDKVLPLQATENDLPQLKRAVNQMNLPDSVIQVRVADETETLPCSEIEVHRFLTGKTGAAAYRPEKPTGRILSILITHHQGECCAYLGTSWATQNLSPWAGGRMPITESVANGAGFKLLEALDVFEIRLRKGNHALDLGAAPGAWTTLLRRRGLRVTAVAPTPLYPWLMFDKEVYYYPILAEEFLDSSQTTFDLIVNDMKMDAQDSARLMTAYAPRLRREGIAIMTLKLREANKRRTMDDAFRLLRKAYKIIRVRQLVSNKKEVTLFLRRKNN